MSALDASDWFARRHIGPSSDERDQMLEAVGVATLDALMDEVIPASIRLDKPLSLPAAESEHQYLHRLGHLALGSGDLPAPLRPPVQADDDDLGTQGAGSGCVGDHARRVDQRRPPILPLRWAQAVVAERVGEVRDGDAVDVEHVRLDLFRRRRHARLAEPVRREHVHRAVDAGNAAIE